MPSIVGTHVRRVWEYLNFLNVEGEITILVFERRGMILNLMWPLSKAHDG